ncbi:MAG: WD40 repeat domain-containing protein, partial [Pseudomonadota bacterium]
DDSSRMLASASDDATVRLWDVVGDGKQRSLLRGHESFATRVVFARTGELFSAGKDGTVRQWDLSTGVSRALVERRPPVYGLALNPIDGRLITGSSDRTIRFWNVDSGGELASLRGHQDVVTSVAVSPDGNALTSSSVDKHVRYWNLDSGDSVVLGRHQDIVTAVVFSPDGRFVVSSSYDSTLRLWRVDAEASVAEDSGHTGLVRSIDFSPDGSSLVSGGEDRSVRTWNVRSGRQHLLLAGHQGPVTGTAFNPDGRTLASASFDRGIRIWDTASGRSEELAPRHDANAASDVAYSSGGQMLASSDASGHMQLWDPRTGTLNGRLRARACFNSIAVSGDGSAVAAATESGLVYVWDGATSKLVAELRGHESESWGIAFAAGGRALVTSGVDGTVRRWDLARKTGQIMDRHDGAIWRLALSPDGSLLGTPSSDGTARIWNLASGERAGVLRGHRGTVRALRFGPDSKLAATGGQDGTVRTWDVATGRPYWRAPLMLRSPPRVFTHLGWVRFDGKQETAGVGAGAAWRQTVEQQAKSAAQSTGDGDRLCLLTHDDELQLWSMTADRLLARVSMTQATSQTPSPTANAANATPEKWEGDSAVVRLAATSHGCLMVAGGRAFLLEGPVSAAVVRDSGRSVATAAIRELADQASAIAVQAGRILIASDRQAQVREENGAETASLAVERGASALGMVGGGRLLAVGYDAGDLELVPVHSGAARPAFSFEETLTSAVEQIGEGPRQTLIVGYASGDLGIWSLETGKRLRHFKLHGPIVHLLVDSETRRLYAATEVGDYRAVDITALYRDYCDLLDDIWSNVPVVWQDGMPALTAPPTSHRCNRVKAVLESGRQSAD